jgi:prepilin-type N-terminal cleavage/methylation domain-containing protein
MAIRGSDPRGEDGFSLIEVLVVVLILSVLAAIAIPSYLSQQKKAQDVDAKTSARELVSHMEACFVEQSDYQLCDTPGELSTILNFSYGNHAGQAETVGAGEDSFTVIAHSRSGADFHIVKTGGQRPERTCSPRDGGCKNDGTW